MERQLSFSIKAFPSPPSVNGLYAYTGKRVVKSKAYRVYEGNVHRWVLMNQDTIIKLRTFFTDIGSYVIHIDTTFNMLGTSIVCKNGKPKRNDTSNRLKALHDVLAAVIGIDDSYFWSGSFSKIPTIAAEDFVDIDFKLRTITGETL